MRFNYFLVCLISLALFSGVYYSPYIVHQYKYLVGFDVGYYVYKSMTQTFSFWDDPLFFSSVASLSSISGVDALEIFWALPVFFAAAILSLSVLILRNRFGLDLRKSILIVVLLTSFSLLFKGLYQAYYKQIFATVLLMYYLDCLDRISSSYARSVLCAVIFSGIFLSHKGVALIAFLLTVFVYIKLHLRRATVTGRVVLFGLVVFVIIGPYVLPLLGKYSAVLLDSINYSWSAISASGTDRLVAGRSLVSDVDSVNPFIDLVSFIPLISVLALLGLFSITLRSRNDFSASFFAVVILSAWLLAGANFSNRFAFNLGFILILFATYFLSTWNWNRRVALLCNSMILIVLLVSAIPFSMTQKPYLIKNTSGMEYVQASIPQDSAYIFASDYLMVTLGQLGYLSPLTDSQVIADAQTGSEEGGLNLSQSDDFLITGHTNLSLLQSTDFGNRTVYVMFGSWETSKGLPRSSISGNVDVVMWDNSLHYEKMYSGSNELIRIYRWRGY